MLNSSRTLYKVYTYTITENAYKEKIKTPVLYKEIPLSLTYCGNSQQNYNDVRLKEISYIGFANEALPEGSSIDMKYSVEFVLKVGAQEYAHYLKEVRA